MCEEAAPLEGLACLGSLRQLTCLHLDVRTAAPACDQLACLSALRRLAVLDWCVGEDGGGEARPESYHRLALPASLQHLIIEANGGMVLSEQLPALARLRTLVGDISNEEDAAAISSARSLTALVMGVWGYVQLPSLLPSLTSLRYLEVTHTQLGCRARMEFLQQLRLLPRLEWLVLRNCSLLSLAPLACLPLRALDVSYNELAAIPHDAGCLATLEYLHCDWAQVGRRVTLGGVVAGGRAWCSLCMPCVGGGRRTSECPMDDALQRGSHV